MSGRKPPLPWQTRKTFGSAQNIVCCPFKNGVESVAASAGGGQELQLQECVSSGGLGGRSAGTETDVFKLGGGGGEG